MSLDTARSIEKTGIKPHIITGGLVQMIRALFSDPGNIEETMLKSYLWNSDPKISRILIEAVYNWRTETVQERPAVIVKRGNWTIGKVAIGDAYSGPRETGFEENQHVVSGSGSHNLFCLALTGAQAELLSTEVYQHLLGFLAVIREQFCLDDFRVTSIGEVGRFEESHTHFVVPVTATYKFTITWDLLRQTPEWARTMVKTEI